MKNRLQKMKTNLQTQLNLIEGPTQDARNMVQGLQSDTSLTDEEKQARTRVAGTVIDEADTLQKLLYLVKFVSGSLDEMRLDNSKAELELMQGIHNIAEIGTYARYRQENTKDKIKAEYERLTALCA